MSRKRIIVITPRFPYPVIGGDKLRIYNICKSLSKKFDMVLVSLCDEKSQLSYTPPDDNVFNEIHKIYHPSWKSKINTALSIFSSKPLQVAYYKSLALDKKLKGIVQKDDILLPHLVRTTEYAFKFDNIVIAELTDSIAMNYSRIAKSNGSKTLKERIFAYEYKKLKKYEAYVTEKSDVVSLISSVDCEFIPTKEKDKSKFVVANNGVDFNNMPYIYEWKNRAEKVICFIGNMHTVQNLDAVRWFLDNVMPRLGHEYTFKIIGKILDKDKLLFERYDRVYVTGMVDSIEDNLHDVDVAVCPMRLGAGVQNKILEYMAYGIPSVVSNLGAEGIGNGKEEIFLKANSVDEYIHEINKIVADRAYAVDISKKARDFIELNHNWCSSLKPLLHKIQGVTK